MHKIWHDAAWEEYLYWQTQDKKTIKKINNLLKDIDRKVINAQEGQKLFLAIFQDFGV